MTYIEKKEAINKELSDVPEAILDEVYAFLKEFKKKTPEEQRRIIGLQRILTEKKELLLRLA
ncbi:MAG: hypothetical protein IPJ76_06965 [Flavobacteriales bacterium]|nr:MAG: hypothetical protein IPJ76_06965 [Flavobacteriales bacterium]